MKEEKRAGGEWQKVAKAYHRIRSKYINHDKYKQIKLIY